MYYLHSQKKMNIIITLNGCKTGRVPLGGGTLLFRLMLQQPPSPTIPASSATIIADGKSNPKLPPSVLVVVCVVLPHPTHGDSLVAAFCALYHFDPKRCCTRWSFLQT